MKKTVIALSLSLFVLALCSSAAAQQSGKVPRIGFLGGGSPSSQSPCLKAFRECLREVGYVEGQNIAIEYRFADGQSDRLPDMVAELVRLDVALIVTGSTSVTQSSWSGFPELEVGSASILQTQKDLLTRTYFSTVTLTAESRSNEPQLFPRSPKPTCPSL